MESQQLTVTTRSARGKGAARQARREGLIPAVCYGTQIESMALCVDPRQLTQVLSGPYGSNTVIDLSIEDDEGNAASRHNVMLKSYQKDPVSRRVIHADFYVIDPERVVDVEVPIELVGRARGVAMGGRLRQVRRSCVVRCRPRDIPKAIEYDVSNLGIKQRALVSQITPPENVEIFYKSDFAIAQINAPKGAAAAGGEAEE